MVQATVAPALPTVTSTMRARPLPLLCTLALLSTACPGDDGGDDGAMDDSTGGTTETPTTTGEPATDTGEPGTSTGEPGTTGDSTGMDSTGEPAEIEVQIQFDAVVGEEDAVCGQTYEGIGASAASIELLDLRFFVSNVRLVDDTGAEVPLAMEDDGEWQYEGSALLDLEDGSAGCSENTTVEMNTTLRGTVPDLVYTGIRFDVGLPFEHNHLNADEAPPPLNTTAMFWNWANGYKFAKIDIANDNPEPGNRWNFHLGSQGCDNGDAGPTVPPEEPCSRPGRPAIALDGFDPLTGTIVLDLAALYTGVDVNADTEMTPPGCMSFMPDVNECTPLFPNLGLTWDTGDCVDDCSGQIAFSAQ